VIREQEESDPVPVSRRGEGDQGTGFRRGLPLLAGAAPERERAGEVDRHDDRQLALLVESLDEGAADAGGDVPIDGADVIARYVLAHLGELQAVSAEGAPVGAREDLLDRPPAPDRETADLREELGGDHGTSTRARILRVTSSTGTASASAS
jgi:hypothetical protein